MPDARLGCKVDHHVRLKRIEQCHGRSMVRKIDGTVCDLISLKEVGYSVIAQSLKLQMIFVAYIEKLILKVINVTP